MWGLNDREFAAINKGSLGEQLYRAWWGSVYWLGGSAWARVRASCPPRRWADLGPGGVGQGRRPERRGGRRAESRSRGRGGGCGRKMGKTKRVEPKQFEVVAPGVRGGWGRQHLLRGPRRDLRVLPVLVGLLVKSVLQLFTGSNACFAETLWVEDKRVH